MTMFKPNIRVDHLSIFKSGRSAYSEEFHAGLNIIRGENSSGKSTIMDFLFYGLGGDLLESQWRETAALCDEVVIGVSLNGYEITLSREIDTKSSRPMRIYMGPWQEAALSSQEGWEKYSYRRGDKESFSQVLFRLLGLPEVQYEEQDTKITINQLLRLLYADQLSPVDKIFRSQAFDDAITRQTVGDLLCGAHSDAYYKAKLRKKAANAELTEITARKSFLFRTHSKDGHPLNMEWLEQEKSSIQTKIDGINSKIEELEKQIFHAQFEDRLSLNDQKSTYRRVVELQAEIGKITSDINDTQLEFEDSESFLAALKTKIQHLSESSSVVEQFKNLSFQFCPACLALLKDKKDNGTCSLCKSTYDHDLTKKRSVRLINEYQRQHEQSLKLQSERNKKIIDLKAEIAKKTELWEQASKHYHVALRTPTTELRTNLRDLNRKAGYNYRNLEELALKRAIIEEIDELNNQAAALTKEINKLTDILSYELSRMKQQKGTAHQKIEDHALWFLKKDLERQASFAKADHFKFEFDGDRMAVNDESFFSASSMVLMRNSFFASFLFAATDEKTFAHPRFLIMDTIEDKGMEPERSQNFQRLLAERSSKAPSAHQVIIATSMIAPELNNDEFTVGEFYTHENRSLNIL